MTSPNSDAPKSSPPMSGSAKPDASLSIFVVAGEASGDRLGAALMRGLRSEHGGDVRFTGVGGAAMAAEGLTSLFSMDDIAVMGVAEVLPRLRTILRRIDETAAAMRRARPDAVVTIDAPDFGLRAAAKARPALGGATTFVHYVAPSVWAWRPKRADKMAKRTDHLLALLPFEPPYFHKVGLSCDFVGHPIVETVSTIDPADRSLRGEYGIADDAPLLVVLPGSRRGEVERLMEPFGDVVARLAERRPALRVIVPAAEAVADFVGERVAGWPGDPVLLDPRALDFRAAERRKFRAMAAADVALAASGTVSLELAAMRTPMAIAYRTSALTAAIVRRMLKIDTATLVNLISETRVVPEFLQENCQPDAILDCLDGLLTPGSAAAEGQRRAAALTMERLGLGDAPPSVRAARSVLHAIARKRSA